VYSAVQAGEGEKKTCEMLYRVLGGAGGGGENEENTLQ
jgi:hypothetical protein